MQDEIKETYKHLYGFKTFDSSCMHSTAVKLSRKIFRKFKPSLFHNAITPITSEELIPKTKKQLFQYFENLDLNINYLPQEELEQKLPENFRHIYTYDQDAILLELISTLKQKINLFEQPIIYEKAQVHDVDYPPVTTSCLTKLPICFDYIALDKNINLQSIVSYIHECMHVLTLRNKGSFGNYYHTEVLSIFMELVTAKDLGDDILVYCEAERFKELSFNYKFLNEYGTGNKKIDLGNNLYIIGILLAEAILDLYLKGNQKIVLNDVETILNGRGTLEELLEDYKINFNNNTIPEAMENAIQKRINRF